MAYALGSSQIRLPWAPLSEGSDCTHVGLQVPQPRRLRHIVWECGCFSSHRFGFNAPPQRSLDYSSLTHSHPLRTAPYPPSISSTNHYHSPSYFIICKSQAGETLACHIVNCICCRDMTQNKTSRSTHGMKDSSIGKHKREKNVMFSYSKG